MYNKILHEQLINSGYQSIKNNHQEIKSVYRIVDGQVFIVTLLGTAVHGLSKEAFSHYRYQLKQLFIDRGYIDVQMLNIYITKDIEATSYLMDEYDYHWFVDITIKRLIIFENQPMNFLEVGGVIHELLMQNRLKLYYKELRRQWGLVTLSLILLNVLVFGIMEIVGSTEASITLLQFGALYPPLLTEASQYYRLASAMFIHIGFEHLMNNMLVLFIIGNRLEKSIGSIKYLILYLASGLIGSYISYQHMLFTGEYAISAGASGAIFGVVGGMLYVVIRNKGQVADIGLRQLVIMAACALYSGFTNYGVDNAAHLGGFFGGILLSILLYRKMKQGIKEI